MVSTENDLPVEFLNFSMTKKKILLHLKKVGSCDLKSLSDELGLTKMGVLKHIEALEKLQIVERFRDTGKKGAGRPKLYLRLGKEATNIFPKAYTSLTCSFLDFINSELGDKGVKAAFAKRKDEVLEEYYEKIQGSGIKDDDFDEKMKRFAKIRNDDGYMVEFKVNTDYYEFMEYNCPIVSVAGKYSEACNSEVQLFKELLEADVSASHKIVSGHEVCKFKIVRPVKR